MNELLSDLYELSGAYFSAPDDEEARSCRQLRELPLHPLRRLRRLRGSYDELSARQAYAGARWRTTWW